MEESLSEALLRCEDEQIRIPGSVQDHGFFLLVDNAFEKILVASENAERFLNNRSDWFWVPGSMPSSVENCSRCSSR